MKRWARHCRHLIRRLDQTSAKLVASQANVHMVKETSLRREAKNGILALHGRVRAFVAVKPDPIKYTCLVPQAEEPHDARICSRPDGDVWWGTKTLNSSAPTLTGERCRCVEWAALAGSSLGGRHKRADRVS